MTNPPDFDKRLTSYLSATPVLDVDPGAAHIASVGRSRTKRRRIAGGALASVALLASAGVVVNRLQTPGTVRTGSAKAKAASDDTTTTETTDAPQPAQTVFATIPGAPGGIDTSNLKWPASNITWQRVDSSLSISNNDGLPGHFIQKEGDTFLAVSTEPAPGKLPDPTRPYFPKSALYSSKDGVVWQQRLIPDLSIGGATMADGALYAVGTATATSQVTSNGDGTTVADLVVAVSEDGKTWKKQTLPLDLRGLAGKGGQMAMGPALIAHSGSTVLVEASVQISLDWSKYLPKGVSDEQGYYEPRDGAIVVYGPPSTEAIACMSKDGRPLTVATIPPVPTSVVSDSSTSSNTVLASNVPPTLSAACEAVLKTPRPVVGTYKLSDLGIDLALATALQNPSHLFVSKAGGPFEAVSPPNALSGQNTGTAFVKAIDDGFLVGRTTYPSGQPGDQVRTTKVVHSVDGKIWTDVGSIEGVVASSGSFEGRFTMAVTDDLGRAKFVRLKSDGSGFENVSDYSNSAALAAIGYQTSIGDAGFLAAVSAGSPSASVGSVSHNGFTFLVTQNPTTGWQQLKVTNDASGEVVADGPLIQDATNDPNIKPDKRIKWAVDGSSDITIVDDKGKTVVSIGGSDLFNQVSQQQQAESVKSMRILDSQDGVTWSATNVSDLVDLAKVPVIGASNLIVDKDRYIVNLLVARSDGGPADTITFVGRRG